MLEVVKIVLITTLSLEFKILIKSFCVCKYMSVFKYILVQQFHFSTFQCKDFISLKNLFYINVCSNNVLWFSNFKDFFRAKWKLYLKLFSDFLYTRDMTMRSHCHVSGIQANHQNLSFLRQCRHFTFKFISSSSFSYFAQNLNELG